jgi:mannosyltransferase
MVAVPIWLWRHSPVAATLLALLIRLYRLDFQNLWRDEVDVIRFSTQGLDTLFQRFTQPGENGPLYYLIHHFWLQACGDSEISLRLPSALFGAAMVPTIYGLARLLLDPTTARISAYVVAVSPYYVWYSQDGKMYALLALLTCASWYLFLRAATEGKLWMWVAFLGVTVVALYTHFFAGLTILAQLCVFPFLARRRLRMGSLVGASLIALPCLPLALWEIPVLANPPTTGYPNFAPQVTATVLLTLFARGFGQIEPVLAVVLALFPLTTAIVLYREGDPPGHEWGGGDDALPGPAEMLHHKAIPIILAMLLVPWLAFTVVSVRLPIFADRYFMGITHAFYLLAATGFTALLRRHRPIFWASAAVWFGVSLYSLAWQSHTTLRADFRSAAATFAAHAEPDDVAIFDMPYIRHNFQYYYHRRLRWIDAPFANDAAGKGRVSYQMAKETAEAKVVWVVSSEEELWDSEALTSQWLRCNASPTGSWEYPGVRLERFLMVGKSGRTLPQPISLLSFRAYSWV